MEQIPSASLELERQRRIRIAMLKRGLTQRTIAEKIGIGQQSVSKILLANTRLLGLQHRAAIAALLELPEKTIWPDGLMVILRQKCLDRERLKRQSKRE